MSHAALRCGEGAVACRPPQALMALSSLRFMFTVPPLILLFGPAGTGDSILVVNMNGYPCQELKINGRFKETGTSFRGFQLMPEVPWHVGLGWYPRAAGLPLYSP